MSPDTSEIENALNRLRPAMQVDGGDVDLVSVEAGVVSVRLCGTRLFASKRDCCSPEWGSEISRETRWPRIACVHGPPASPVVHEARLEMEKSKKY